MSSETQIKSCLNFPMKSKISKQKVHRLDLKKWETSMKDFNESAVDKKLSLRKRCNEIPKKIFRANVHNSLKRKSISGNNIIEPDFFSLNNHAEEFYSLSSDPSPQKEKKTCSLKNASLNICDIRDTFEKKTEILKLDSNSQQSEATFENRAESVSNILKHNSNFQQCVYSENFYKSKKRKPISDKNIWKTDYLCTNSLLKPSGSELQNKRMKILKHNSNFQQCVFSENFFKSIKKKSISDKSLCETDFLYSDSLSKSALFSASALQIEKMALLQKDFTFNIHDIEAPFDIETLRNRCVHFLQHASIPKLKKCAMMEKDLEERSKQVFSIPEEFAKSTRNITQNTRNIAQNTRDSAQNTHIARGRSKSLNESSTENCFGNDLKHGPAEIEKGELTKNLLNSAVSCSGQSIGVGSDWVHSLKQTNENYPSYEGKKKIQNLLVGGYCEQILKFQRRELSEKAINDHKKGAKNTSDCVLVRMNSIIYEYEIIVADCSFVDTIPEEVAKSISGFSEDFTSIIILFQKSSFHKQMKTGKHFFLSLPWHLIEVKSFKRPVIICKYFKAVAVEQIPERLAISAKQNEVKFQNTEQEEDNSFKDFHEDKFLKKCEAEEDMLNVWKKRLNICARIQRIWKCKMSLPLNHQHGYRLTLLLQTKGRADFYVLRTSSLHNRYFINWLQFVEKKEECFYFFDNLKVSHKLEKKRYPKLFQFLQNLLQENNAPEIQKDFVYQLSVDEMTKIPSKKSEVPKFLTFNYQLLSDVIKRSAGRVCCRARVLLKYRSVLYVKDDSIPHSKYVKVFLHLQSFSASAINITDALISEGELYLDEYSQISSLPLTNEFGAINVTEFPLAQDSKVADIVTVKGNITYVDENNACIWLQCNICMRENLVQNLEEVVFCEDCCLVVKQPVLKVKMSITITSEPNFLLNIELSSCTIKRILSLSEHSFQTQCNVSDVLGKEIGPILCYISGLEINESHSVFHLIEVVGH